MGQKQAKMFEFQAQAVDSVQEATVWNAIRLIVLQEATLESSVQGACNLQVVSSSWGLLEV